MDPERHVWFDMTCHEARARYIIINRDTDAITTGRDNFCGVRLGILFGASSAALHLRNFP